MTRILTFLVFSAALCVSTAAQTAEQINAIFADLSPDAPGAAVLVLRNGKTVFQRGYGVADLRTKKRIDAKTDFRLASFTKQFTAMSIMLLVHDGKLRYDEPLTEVFPDFPAYGNTVTIANLLNHASGLVAYEDVMDKQYSGTPDEQIPQVKDAGVLAIMKQQTSTKFPPGSKWEYSNSGYATLAMVVEKASGQPFGEFLRQRIFKPLGMKHTLAYEKGKNDVPRRAFGHSPIKDGTGWRETDQSSTSAVLGDGGIYTNLDDLKRWVKALDHYRLLSAEEMKPAYTAVVVPRKAADIKAIEDGKTEYQEPWDRPNPAYGYGWFLDPFRGHRRIFHDGSTIGGKTTIQRLPDDGLTVIILSNRGNFDPGKRAEKILELFVVPEVTGSESLQLRTCGKRRFGTQRIGWGNYGPRFDVASHDVQIIRGTPDVDYVKHLVKAKKGGGTLQLWFGPYAISAKPDDKDIQRSSEFRQRKVILENGNSIGFDSRGVFQNGLLWRHTSVGPGGAVYSNATKEAAHLFDQIIDSVCDVSFPKK